MNTALDCLVELLKDCRTLAAWLSVNLPDRPGVVSPLVDTANQYERSMKTGPMTEDEVCEAVQDLYSIVLGICNRCDAISADVPSIAIGLKRTADFMVRTKGSFDYVEGPGEPVTIFPDTPLGL